MSAEMLSMTVTDEAHVEIPLTVVQALGLRPGDRLVFHAREDRTVVIEIERADLRALRGIIKPGVRGVTVEDMDQAIRDAASR